MAQKQFFLLFDTETTVNNNVLDFGAVVVDRKGNIYHQIAVIINDFNNELPYHEAGSEIWALETRKRVNQNMLDNGSRMLASVNAVNTWLAKVAAKYPNIILTAYNIAFDLDKCNNSGIRVDQFANRFCLWHAANATICETKNYLRFALQNHLFNNVTSKGNMSIKTGAEAVGSYLAGFISKEPHTSLEDVIHFELPILLHIVNKRGWQNKIKPYNWQERQVRDFYKI